MQNSALYESWTATNGSLYCYIACVTQSRQCHKRHIIEASQTSKCKPCKDLACLGLACSRSRPRPRPDSIEAKAKPRARIFVLEVSSRSRTVLEDSIPDVNTHYYQLQSLSPQNHHLCTYGTQLDYVLCSYVFIIHLPQSITITATLHTEYQFV